MKVVGLGNPGMEGTRHCVGIQVVCALAAHLGLAEHWRSDRQLCGEVNVVDARCLVLLRPQVLMNVNGVAVAKAASKYGVQPEDILLVHDEMDKPLGKVAIKHGGSARKTTSLSTPSTSMSNIIIVPIGTHQYHTCHKQRFSCGNPDAAQSHLDSASCGPQRSQWCPLLHGLPLHQCNASDAGRHRASIGHGLNLGAVEETWCAHCPRQTASLIPRFGSWW
ncbi:peptidyl-tRNA hydrolase isoform X3 [Stigmatopora nigra]